ncbi:hypothetical protein [Burkholderia phage FLC6]|nr:hypothetical protein [Burkholderia phage FLC6]BDD79367.1 hypothetical protein [Burkholderia phage FLC8]
MQEWKMWREVYNNLVTDHTDARHKHAFVVSDTVVDDAIEYITNRSELGRYPGKSRIVAIIYAFCVSETYGEDFLQVLDDPELFHSPDEFFVPYSQDKDSYDAILARLKDIPGWIEGGWAPKTVEYFHLECTEAGVASIS